MRGVARIVAVAAVPAVLAGLVLHLAHGATPLSRSVALFLWLAAALCLVAMPLLGSKLAWKSFGVQVEGWMLVAAAVLLTGAGAALDATGF
ncbi:MAG: hypothetical protein ACYDBR_06250 [Gaiellaceae bacterium]